MPRSARPNNPVFVTATNRRLNRPVDGDGAFGDASSGRIEAPVTMRGRLIGLAAISLVAVVSALAIAYTSQRPINRELALVPPPNAGTVEVLKFDTIVKQVPAPLELTVP